MRTRAEILQVIAADLGVESASERVTILLRALEERLIALYGAGRRVVAFGTTDGSSCVFASRECATMAR